MARYIDAEPLPHGQFWDNCTDTEKAKILSWILGQPTADVVEVKHGEWEYHECVSSHEGVISGYACSCCRAFVDEEIFDTDEFHKEFCGNCGAKMNLEVKK